MNPNAFPTMWMVFVGLWGAAGIANWWFMATSKDAVLKRRVLIRVVVGAGVVFTAVVYVVSGGDLRTMALVVPAVAVISYLNLRFIHFCQVCGATLHAGGFHKARFCSRCGSLLGQQEEHKAEGDHAFRRAEPDA